MDINQLYDQRVEGKTDALASMRDYTKELTDLKDGFKAGDTSGTFMHDYAKKKQEGFSSQEDLNSLRKINRGADVGGEKAMGDIFDRLKFQQAEMTGARKTVDERLQAFGAEAQAKENEAAFKHTWWKEDVTEDRQKKQHAMSIASQAQSMSLQRAAAERAKVAAANKAAADAAEDERAETLWNWKVEDRGRADKQYDRDEKSRYLASQASSRQSARTYVGEPETPDEQAEPTFLDKLSDSLFDITNLPDAPILERAKYIDTLNALQAEGVPEESKETAKALIGLHGSKLLSTIDVDDPWQPWVSKEDAEIKAIADFGVDEKIAAELVKYGHEQEKKIADGGEIRTLEEARLTESYYYNNQNHDGGITGIADVTPGHGSIRETDNSIKTSQAVARQEFLADEANLKEIRESIELPASIYKTGTNEVPGIEAELIGYMGEMELDDKDLIWEDAVDSNGNLQQLDVTKYNNKSQQYVKALNKRMSDIETDTYKAEVAQGEAAAGVDGFVKLFAYNDMEKDVYSYYYGEDEYKKMSEITNEHKVINVGVATEQFQQFQRLRESGSLSEDEVQKISNVEARFREKTVMEVMQINDPNFHIYQMDPSLFGNMTPEMMSRTIGSLRPNELAEVALWQGAFTGTDTSIMQNPFEYSINAAEVESQRRWYDKELTEQ